MIAPNALKGSLGAIEAAAAMGRGFAAGGDWDIRQVPMADGGDGTAAVLRHLLGGTETLMTVSGPQEEPMRAGFTRLPGGRAVLDLASASGLALLGEGRLDPMTATTRGTGQLLRAALESTDGEVIVALGGSATVDGGLGLLQALGVIAADADQREVPSGGRALAQLRRLDPSGICPAFTPGRVLVALDVASPLLGEAGAAAVFGPQKGAGPVQVHELEEGLANLATILARDLGVDVTGIPGAGAAGGAGAALAALGCRMESGAELVARLARLLESLAGAQLAVTAEGHLDAQTSLGKAPAVVARLASAAGVPCVALAGVADADAFAGFTQVLEIGASGESRPDQIAHAAADLERCCRELAERWGE